ncbi:P-loop containing nucleoside triphosphate hydrolase protein [Artomyces pyxidatus]|uniref:P-loop containing nucleoside triphosphate hydrolase protein n=1 Tax=Artomyces pyxidatus TaxID=48021 RepID=A0ACB8SRJ8_9AGAM|nr:P-loop containing nucleoside triphosphate hydrolase protein [Artomyces pyxidatus]
MPRKTQPVIADDDSQKENSMLPGTPRVKPEKHAEKRDMHHQSDDDAEGSDDPEEEEGSPKGRKRTRVNEDGEGRPVKNEKKGKAWTGPEALVRDVDGYVPGSIVRVKLQNFVTYDHVEFRPGPHLNMIIGPNGTGKSSIACAIALGLNFPPSILGRAAELNSFVKMGTEEGFIEIELKGQLGRPNLVVRRNLSAKSKGSTYALNGQPATGREVTQKMSELNVQVGNLCSFLPQDKVSEFAHMSPQQLLRETQRAAGDERLTAWHDTLISSGKELAEVMEVLTTDRVQMKTLEERNAMLERDVQRFKERQELQRQIALLELILPFMEYVEVRRLYQEAKEKQRGLHQRVVALKAKNAPLHEFKKRLEIQHKRLNEQRDEKKKATQKKFKAMGLLWNENERMSNDEEDIQTKLTNIKRNERARLQKIQNLEKQIEDQQRQLDQPVKLEKIEDIQEELRLLNQEGAKTRQRQDELHERQLRNVEETSRADAEIKEGNRALQQLDNVAHQRLESLRRFDRDCAEIIVWLRENRSRFRMEIIEPAIVSVNVPDRRFANAVEACFNGSQLRTFVAQCEEDYQLLNRLFVDTHEAMGRKMSMTSWFRPGNENNVAPPPMSVEEMKELGFDGYAIDYVDCPAGLRSYLMRELNLHRTAIGLNPGRIDPARAMAAVGRSGGASYVIGMTMNTVMRSKYGRQLAQNHTRDIQNARNFVGPTVDPTAKRSIQERVAQAQERRNIAMAEQEQLAAEDKELKRIHNEYKAKYDGLNNRKSKVMNEKKRLQKLEGQIHAAKMRLEELNKAPSLDAEREKLKSKLRDLMKKRAAIAKQYAELIRSAIKEQVVATKLGLQYLQVGSNKAALDVLIQERDYECNEALAAFNDAHKVYNRLKAESKEKLELSKEKLDSVDDDVRDEFQKMEENGTAHQRDSEQLRDELETLQQKLELVLATNPGVIEQYERRKNEIENLTKKIEERERKVSKVEKSIQTARDNWEPALQGLVNSIGEKFSAAFDRIGCAGELQLTPHEDFDKWAITILVKFRDTEKLQQLTAHRQSGGERSLTTILYLMSMTEHARAPFSLVDEINQGMDQRAERTVHNELVKTTCRPDSGQYFLITPKLLPDLKYDPLMKVLCVNNGEWLPDDNSLGNMMSMIKTYVQKQKKPSAAAA